MNNDKEQYSIEYIIRTSPQVLYNYLATPGGLSKWFADNVILQGDIYKFIWEDSEEPAQLISKKKNRFIKFQWVGDEGTDLFFKFDIQKDTMTNDTVIKITDSAPRDEIEEAKELWNSQVEELKHILGC